MKFFLKNKKGMTYVELLVAFTLLVLIVFVFSPMLLSSYSTIYEAGAREEDAYNAKSDIETHLALRTARAQYNNFMVQFKKNATEVVNSVSVSGKKITTNVLETLFYNGKPHIRIISGPVIDNTSYHKVALSAENLNFTASTVTAASTKPTTLAKNAVQIMVTAPVKTTSGSGSGDSQYADDSQVETAYAKNIPIDDKSIVADPINGLISFEISGFDFTVSPIRLRIYYINDSGKIDQVDTYIEVEMPTLILGGESKSGADYYTTAGVTSKTVSSQQVVTVVNQLSAIEPRTMSSGTATDAGKITTPSNFKVDNKDAPVTIQSISYINNQLELGKGLQPYYVLTGSNGAIYRTYGFSTKNAFTDYSKYTNEHYYTVKNTGDAYRTTVYPTFWSGDNTHQFYYTTYYDSQYSLDYGGPNSDRDGDHSWRTEDTNNRGTGTQTFTNRATFSYFRNGYDVNFEYRVQQKKSISYILTERGTALRLHGRKLYTSDFLGSQIPWNTNSKAANPLTEKTDDKDKIYYLANAMQSEGTSLNQNQFCQFSALSATSINTGSVNELLTDVDDDDCQSFLGGKNSGKHDYSSSSKVNITSGAYIESLGKMLYLGTVDANAYVLQQDNDYKEGYGTTDFAADYYYLNDYRIGGTTGYCIIGTTDAEGTTIYKASTDTDNINDIASGTTDMKFMTSGGVDRAYVAPVITVEHQGEIIGYRHSKHNNKHDDYNKQSSCWCGTELYSGSGITHVKNGDATIDVETYQRIKKHDDEDGNMFWKERARFWEPIYAPTTTEIVTNYNNITSVSALNGIKYTNASDLGTSSNVKYINDYSNGTVNDELNRFYATMTAQNVHIPDLYFTLGYSSNREFVYSLISFGKSDKNNNGKLDSGDDDYLTEKYKSYEPYYFLSHYGKGYSMVRSNKKYSLVSSHSPNYTPNGSSTNLNSYNNDYYNVWFPGECYNLTTTATLNSVVVGVGYTVSGSAYQWMDIQGNGYAGSNLSATHNTSTALGGIFNDGVLAVCTPGATNFENKLYFKDNATMDADYFTDSATNTTAAFNSTWNSITFDSKPYMQLYFAGISPASADNYKAVFGANYGTHARQSVRFTSVGLGTLANGSGDNYCEDYYAYYGDSTGRVFYSKVATEKKNGSTVAVSYVADLTATDTVRDADGAGKMEELKIGGSSLRTLFTQIDNITVKSYSATGESEYSKDDNYDIVVISGKKEGSNTNYIVVAKVGADSDGKAKIVNCQQITISDSLIGSGYSIEINDSVFLNGYYYAVGVAQSNTTKKGFLLAVDETALKSFINKEHVLDSEGHETPTLLVPNASDISMYYTTQGVDANKNTVTLNPLYSIGGRSA